MAVVVLDRKSVRLGDAASPWSDAMPLKRRAVGWLRAVAREPLIHFLLLGTILFLIMDGRHAGSGDHQIVLDHGRMDKLAADYRAEYGQSPSPVEMRAMADRYVSDEIYFREGLALGIDRDDEIIRRRIVQKMQFVSQDRYVPEDIDGQKLKAYYDAHRSAYVTPPRTSFSHVFFDVAKGDGAARARAEAALRTLSRTGLTRAPDRGDRFTDLYDYGAIDADGLKRLFGDSDIVAAAAKAPIGRWSGPYRSAYGWHLIYVSARAPAAVQPLAAVEARVRSDAAEDRQAAANAEAYAALRARYRVVGDEAGLVSR